MLEAVITIELDTCTMYIVQSTRIEFHVKLKHAPIHILSANVFNQMVQTVEDRYITFQWRIHAVWHEL